MFSGINECEWTKAEMELLRMLSESEEDVRARRVASIAETFEGVRALLLAKENG